MFEMNGLLLEGVAASCSLRVFCGVAFKLMKFEFSLENL